MPLKAFLPCTLLRRGDPIHAVPDGDLVHFTRVYASPVDPIKSEYALGYVPLRGDGTPTTFLRDSYPLVSRRGDMESSSSTRIRSGWTSSLMRIDRDGGPPVQMARNVCCVDFPCGSNSSLYYMVVDGPDLPHAASGRTR